MSGCHNGENILKTAYFECASGISGDMVLGALLDLGIELSQLEQAISALPVKGYKLVAEKVKRQHISGTRLKVEIDHENQPHRHLSNIKEIISVSTLPDKIKERAIHIFQRVAEAEAKIHGTSVEQVHFHELGAVDTIIDIVGALVCLEILGIEQIVSSPLPLGHGTITCAHGQLPVPAPAALELLKGCPVYAGDTEGELVTPTGAAIISTLAKSFSRLPLMNIQNTGYGAGSRDYSPRPNLLRVIMGESQEEHASSETLTKMEADIDDMNPQLYGWLTEKLFSAGASDVILIPIYMKKNRPATRLNVFAHPHLIKKLTDIIFEETTTIGLRFSHSHKMVLSRSFQQIDTPWGPVSIKIAQLPNNKFKYKAEYEDCKKIARQEGISIKEVYAKVEQLAEKTLNEK